MSEIQSFPVSRLVENINKKLARIDISQFWISGELSNVRRVSGNYYFDLKDEGGQISCTIWQSAARGIDFTLEDGQQVLVKGDIGVYVKRGQLQLRVHAIQLNGIGALFIELEKRRRKLEAEGYFNPAHKKPRPAWIENIAIVTGQQTAALQDVMKTIHSRWPMLQVTLYPALVQGQTAPSKIIKALKKADQNGHDAILLVRGGGSIEDLFCFNDEDIVKTLYGMNTYTVTGIGHEIDTTLADYAADHRAVTPTAAAQWVTPDQKEVMAALLDQRQAMYRKTRAIFDQNASRLVYLQSNPWLLHPEKWIENKKMALHRSVSELNSLQARLIFTQRNALNALNTGLLQAVQNYDRTQTGRLNAARPQLLAYSPKARVSAELVAVSQKKKELIHLARSYQDANSRRLRASLVLLEAVSPLSVLDRGYALITKDGKPVSSTAGLSLSDQVDIRLKDGSAKASIEEIMYGKPE
ncbi:MAG: exodeoxyribonuclease VII large subunit [Erysipelotrichaceae bacterium]|nr:exodeoxyribonuclease VII large subunit [Erysipelotrichaceae bacterium]